MGDTLILIPAHNEEHSIGRVMEQLNNLNLVFDVLVVDDGSSDNTALVAQKYGAQVIRLPYNLGYGGALQTGFKYAVSKNYSYVVTFDGDGQHDPFSIERIMDKLGNNQADIVIGSRFLDDYENTGFLKLVAIAFLRLIIRFSTRSRITDPTSGIQGLAKSVFNYYSVMGNYPVDYPDADILITMLRFRYRVVEIPTTIQRRVTGKSMHSGLKPLFYMVKTVLSVFIVLLRFAFSNGGNRL